MTNDQQFMQRALELANFAEEQGEVPVGAVIVLDGKIVGEGYNQPIASNDPTSHAEIVALRMAGSKLKNYRIPNSIVYVTLEPCSMCLEALRHARIKHLVYAASDTNKSIVNHNFTQESGILAEPCAKLLKEFFVRKRL